ncbi:STY4526/YPO1902 family pathogenicity island replication protein [Alicycliphilus denitrificans]|uniref:STY4526/YPO1902 family pathogenicity island replication protein n=1 Tax=Alicycliphilus denitrificans TaxID=179636 RepID=UPI00384F84D9
MKHRIVPVDIRQNPQLIFLALTEVIRVIDTDHGLDQLLGEGFSAELIDKLRRRDARDLLDLSNRLTFVSVNLPTREMLQQLDCIDRRRRDDEMCEYFVKHGAQRALINKLFKRTPEEIRRLRELVGGGSIGRTKLPKEYGTRDHIHVVWHHIKESSDYSENLRDWLYALHQKFPDYSIDTLYSTVKEFEDIYVEDKISNIKSLS